jgi:hypothetical protein
VRNQHTDPSIVVVPEPPPRPRDAVIRGAHQGVARNVGQFPRRSAPLPRLAEGRRKRQRIGAGCTSRILLGGQGDFDALTTSDLDPQQVGDLGALAGASSGVLCEDDAAAAAGAMTPNSIGLLIVYENPWSLPFAVAARKAGGQLVASGHIPTQALVAALDDLES